MRKNKKNMYEIFWNTEPRNFFSSIPKLMNNILDVLKAIDKDFSDTFKPYKAFYAFKRDILQPLFGLKNIFLGLLAIPAIPFMFLWDTFKIPLLVNKHVADLPKSFFMKSQIGLLYFSANLVKSFLQAGYCIASILQGVTQILTTPLTWLFKVPIRLFITPVGGPKIEENSGFKRELLTYSDSFESQAVQCHELHRKYRKQAQLGQATNLDGQDESSTYEKLVRLTSFLQFYYIDGVVDSIGYKSYLPSPTATERTEAQKATLAYLSLFRQKKPLSSNVALVQASEHQVALT